MCVHACMRVRARMCAHVCGLCVRVRAHSFVCVCMPFHVGNDMDCVQIFCTDWPT